MSNSNQEFDQDINVETIIDNLEQECYLKADFNNTLKDEVKSKIEEFSNWFNSTARLYFLRCDPNESETCLYLLLNLKKKLKFAISEINKSVSNRRQWYICDVCGEKIDIEPWQNVWSRLQDHPHFEECYSNIINKAPNMMSESTENSESSTNDSIEDLSEDLNQVVLAESEDNNEKPQEAGINDFKFNFIVTYDQRVEETLYPETLVGAARKRDQLTDYTVQRCGACRGVCLLCPCSLISRGRVYKITPFVIKNHVSGQKHLKHAATAVNTSALKQYHEFWRSQEPAYQAHQVYFIPEIGGPQVCKCQLCMEFVPYCQVIDHINDKSHRNKVLKIFNSPEGKLNEFYLLDMQVEVYDIVVNHDMAKKEEKPKNNKSESNGTVPPKCVFVKFVPEPNQINLPTRFKDHLDHFEIFTKNPDLVNCRICKISFYNSAKFIRNHILNVQHRQLSGIPVLKYTFFCEICNIYLKNEDAWEEHFVKGPNRHDAMSEGRKQKVAEYECKTCNFVIYGDELSLTRHISTRSSKGGRAKEVKLPFSVKKLFRSKNFIEDEATRLQVEATQVFEYQDKMQECCVDLQQALSTIYPTCQAYRFGSRISGLGNNQSDLDVFMDIGDMYLGEKFQDSQCQEQFVKKATKVLKSCKENFSSVVPIPSARTPIVKLHHNYTDLDCDLSFRHGLGVENTKFLKFCIDLQPITQPFILLLKKWSDYCKLNEHITNYGLALMAVFFLQTRGYLLSVKTVRNYNPTKSVVIDGWDTLIYTVPVEIMQQFVQPYTSNIKQLLRDFFYYFSKFDYANDVVCPLLGNTIPKLLFNEKPGGESLPPEMKSYVQRIQSENGELFRGLTPFCIQDPFDLSHNLTKACQHGTINKLKALCTLTYEFLDSIE